MVNDISVFQYLLSKYTWRSIDEHNLTIFCPYIASFLIDVPAPHLRGAVLAVGLIGTWTSSLFILYMENSSHRYIIILLHEGFLKTFEGILCCISLIKGIHFHIRLIKEGSNILSVKGGLIDVVIRDRGGT